MKRLFIIALVLSLVLNIYFIVDENKWATIEYYGEVFRNGPGSSKTSGSWQEGWTIFRNKLLQRDRKQAEKKYYYVNVWTSTCKPCIREMPWLDTLALGLSNDVGYFFVTDMSESSAQKFLERLHFKPRKFVFIHDMRDLVTSARKQMKLTGNIYPISFIINNQGEMLFSSMGGYATPNDALKFKQLIQQLN